MITPRLAFVRSAEEGKGGREGDRQRGRQRGGEREGGREKKWFCKREGAFLPSLPPSDGSFFELKWSAAAAAAAPGLEWRIDIGRGMGRSKWESVKGITKLAFCVGTFVSCTMAATRLRV